ncbi:MAG: hypothetical protein K1X92_02300 [Bacteroidia bacterium]|nr:hypothetical protein [Bacteroidia bacterium]
MKHFNFILFLLLFHSVVFAQDKNQGRVSYDMLISSPPIFEQLSKNAREKLPMSVKHKVNVYFKDTYMRYEDTTLVRSQKKTTEVAYKNSEAGWLINFSDGMWYLMHQLDGKVYYAEEPLSSQQWRFTVSLYDATPEITTKYQRQIYKLNNAKVLKITDETKEILGYKCRKAYYQSGIAHLDGVANNDDIEFWFTEDFPKNVSPLPCNLVKGAVLELKSHRIHYIATGIYFEEVPETSVALPRDGIKMTIYTEEQMIDRYMLKRD